MNAAASLVDYAVRNGVATVALARPERANALSAALVATLHEAIDRACANASLHTLVLRGHGRHFCTGFDLTDVERASDGDLLLRVVRIELLLGALWHAPLSTIALAHGRAFGAGADLFAACDRRIAAPEATFGFPGARFGLVLGSRRLASRIGDDAARRCTAEGAVLPASEALRLGLATEIVATDAFDARVAALPAPVADRATLQGLRSAVRADRRDADLAAMVRSAAVPGLAQRLARYKAGLASAAESRR